MRFNEIMYFLLISTFWCRKVTGRLSKPQKRAADVAQSDRRIYERIPGQRSLHL